MRSSKWTSLAAGALLIGLGACLEVEPDLGDTDTEALSLLATGNTSTSFVGWSANWDRNAASWDRNAMSWDRNAMSWDRNSTSMGGQGQPGFGVTGGYFDASTGTYTRLAPIQDINDAYYMGDAAFGASPDGTIGFYTRANAVYIVADPRSNRAQPCGTTTGGAVQYCDIDGTRVTPALALGFTKSVVRPDGTIEARRPAFLRGDTSPPRWEVVGPGEAFVLPLLAVNGHGRAFPIKYRIEYQGKFRQSFADGTVLSTVWSTYYEQWGYVDKVVNGAVVPCLPGECPLSRRWTGAYRVQHIPLMPPAVPRAQGGVWSTVRGWQSTTAPFGHQGGHIPGLVGKSMVGTDAAPGEVVSAGANAACTARSEQLHASFSLAYGNGFQATTYSGFPGEKAVDAVFFLTADGQAIAASGYAEDGSPSLSLASTGQLLLQLQRNPAFENDGTLGNVGSLAAPTYAGISGTSVAAGVNRTREQAFLAAGSNQTRQAIHSWFQQGLAAAGGASSTYGAAIATGSSPNCDKTRAQHVMAAFSPLGKQTVGSTSTVSPGCPASAAFGHCDVIYTYPANQYNCGDGVCDFFAGESLCPTFCSLDCVKSCISPDDPDGLPPPPEEDEDDDLIGLSELSDEMVGDILDGDQANGPNDDADFEIDLDAFDLELSEL